MNFSFFRSNPFSTFQLFNLRMIIAKPQLHVVRDGIVSIEFSTNSSAFGVNERAVKRDRVQKWPKGWTLSTDIRYMAWCVGFDSKLKHVLVHKVYNFVTRKRWAHHMGLRSKKILFFFKEIPKKRGVYVVWKMVGGIIFIAGNEACMNGAIHSRHKYQPDSHFRSGTCVVEIVCP